MRIRRTAVVDGHARSAASGVVSRLAACSSSSPAQVASSCKVGSECCPWLDRDESVRVVTGNGAHVPPQEGLTAPTAHVVFPLEQDPGGWPPVASERLWAFDLGDSRYRLDNTPWFVRGISTGDTVVAHATSPEGSPVFERVVERSHNLTLRIICLRSGPLAGNLQAVLDAFVPLGADGEGAAQWGMVALNVSPVKSYEPIFRRLEAGVRNGSWEFEEGCVNPTWLALHDGPSASRKIGF